jgi:hypothetical protein
MASLMVYDPTIRDHLKKSDVTLDELLQLRERVRETIRQQGNLSLALIDLDEEIDRRRDVGHSRK